ncbi:MAG: hypothetical protein ACOYNC_00350 [Bacteroidales bacterium]
MLNIFIPVKSPALPNEQKSTASVLAKSKLIILLFTITAITHGHTASGANYYTRGSGHWSSPTMWATSAGGVPCGCYPASTDAVFIGDGHTLTADGNHTVASLTFEDNSITGTLNVNAGVILNVTGAIIIKSLTPQHKWALVEGQGTITANSVSVGHNMTPYTSSQSTALYIQGSISFSVAGDVSIYANENYDITNNAAVSLRSGTLMVGGKISLHAEPFSTCTFQTAETGQLQTGNLTLTGSAPWSLTGTGTIKTTLTGSSATTEYRGIAAQTILGTTYTNLKINTDGTAMPGAPMTVTGTFFMTKGIFSLNGKSLAYGSLARLKYDGIAAQTTGDEWPAQTSVNITVSNNCATGIMLNEDKMIQLPGALSVEGNLDFGTAYISGTGAFTLATGGTLSTSFISNGEGFGTSGDNTKGSIRNSGTRDLGTNGNFILQGTGTSQATGTNMPGEVNSLTLNNDAGVILSQNTTVNGSLTFSAGILTTGDKVITAGPSATIVNSSPARYVNGRLARSFSTTGSKEFAVGKNGNYRPIYLDFTALSGTAVVSAEQFESPIPGSSPENATLWGVRYWSVTESGGSACVYRVTLNGTGFTPAHTARMIKGDGISNTAYTVTSPDYTNVERFTSFSNFALGEANIVTTTTPSDQTSCIGNMSVVLTANVYPQPDGGTVQFYLDDIVLGEPAVLIGGVATTTCDPSLSTLPMHTIRADFSGYGDYLAGSSDPGNNAILEVATGIWLGTASADWHNPDNWCSGVPTLSTDVIIPDGTPFMPHITSGPGNPAACLNLSIHEGTTLTVAEGSVLTVHGTVRSGE